MDRKHHPQAAIAAAVALAGTAISAGPAAAFSITQFRSPTGNIGCVITRGAARCDIAQHQWTPQPHHCADGDWGNAFAVGRRGRGGMICASDSALDPQAKPLAYGTSKRFDGYVCSSATTGMTCRRIATGHGFFVSIQSYRGF